MATWDEVGKYINTNNFEILEEAPKEMIDIGDGGYRVERNYKDLSWVVSVRKTHTNFNWMIWMALWQRNEDRPDTDPNNKAGQYKLAHLEMGMPSLYTHVDYALREWDERKHYVEYRKLYADELWNEVIDYLENVAPDESVNFVVNTFVQRTGHDIRTSRHDISYKLDGDEPNKDPDSGFDYDKPADDDYDFDWSGSKNKGLFTVFYLMYDYFDFMYHLYYNLIDKMMGLSKYPAIRQNYDPSYNDDAFMNFYLMIIGYYASVAGLGMTYGLYKLYKLAAN